MKNGQVLPVKLGGYECIGSPVLIVDPQTTAILDANESACKFYGHTHAEFVQMKIMDISMISLEESWQRIRRDSAGDVNRLFTQHRLANGKICDVEVYFGRGNLEDKPVSIATVHDITERNRMERILQESEQKYRGFVSQTNEAFTLVDEQGVAIEWNPASEKLTGIPASEVIGQFVWDVQLGITSPEHVTTEMRDLMRQRIQTVLETGSGPLLDTYETEIKRRDGKSIIAAQKLFTIKTAQGFQLGTIARDITQERQAQKDLKVSEERYRLLFENMREGFSLYELIFDNDSKAVDARILAANAAYKLHTGLSPADVIGKTIMEVMPQTPLSQLEPYFKVALTGEPSSLEYFSPLFQRYFRTQTFCPQPGQFASIVEDITERKNTEFLLQAVNTELEKRVQERTLELHRSLERLNLATGSANMGIWDWDIQKNELVWDQQMYTLYGVKPEDFSGAYEAWLGGVYPDDRQHSDEFAQRALRGEVTYDTELRVLWPDGSTHWLKVNGRVFWDEQGEPVRMLGLNYDITERKNLGNELRESEQKYFALFQKAAIPAALTKMPEGVFVEVNEAFQGKFGYINDEIYGKTSVDIGLVKPEERAETYMELERHGFVQNNEKHLLTKTGETRDCLINANPVSFNGQDFVITTIADVTERKQAETRLVETNIALEKALRVKDGFLAAISHELRTPLTGIMGMTEMLQLTAASALNPRQVEYLANIKKSGERLLSLINNLLEFTRLQSAVGTLECHPCHLAEVCQTSLHKIAASAEAKHQRVHFSPPSSEIVIQTDERRLFKSLFLLLDNASKFTAEGGEFGIEITERAGSGLVDITVWDTGIGIAEEHLQNLFRPFMQLDASLARQYDGAGLGLALVKGTIELLNGTVSAQSTLGKGSRFIVTLPWNKSEMV